ALYGIVPHEFGRVAWFRDGLLPSHWFNYLNLLSHSPAAALISRSLAEEADLSPGDPIYLRWGDQPLTLYYVYGVVDYWPGYNPFAGGGAGARQHLAVVNLNYMHATTALEPYQVWFALDDGVTSAEFYEALTVGRVNPTRVQDASQELIRRRNDPMLQGTNGTLSLGFLVSLGICFVGFLLYWVFSIRDRTLQFGLFRAMGMSKSSIIGMLGLEQLFVSGAAVAAGFAIGRIASELFVPLLQAVRSAEQAVPPFRVVSLGVDQLRITIFVTVMLLFGFGILSVVLSRIKIHQAVKLGEE
ncbi:MAG: ABC transporter permease, partial [Spirochaetaceae bacterium]